MGRYDGMGLIWLLKGERVVELTATGARLSGVIATVADCLCRSRLYQISDGACASRWVSPCINTPAKNRLW
jgi:hypothetical protein